jgi:formylglycine-generating enzyme required for sulfatase activity
MGKDGGYNVSWYDCVEFINKINGGRYHVRLPTEREWEYAFRAGRSTVLNADIYDNPWGFCYGDANSYEWCEDRASWWNYDRVARSAGYYNHVRKCREGTRLERSEDFHYYTGCRLVCDIWPTCSDGKEKNKSGPSFQNCRHCGQLLDGDKIGQNCSHCGKDVF